MKYKILLASCLTLSLHAAQHQQKHTLSEYEFLTLKHEISQRLAASLCNFDQFKQTYDSYKSFFQSKKDPIIEQKLKEDFHATMNQELQKNKLAHAELNQWLAQQHGKKWLKNVRVDDVLAGTGLNAIALGLSAFIIWYMYRASNLTDADGMLLSIPASAGILASIIGTLILTDNKTWNYTHYLQEQINDDRIASIDASYKYVYPGEPKLSEQVLKIS